MGVVGGGGGGGDILNISATCRGPVVSSFEVGVREGVGTRDIQSPSHGRERQRN